MFSKLFKKKKGEDSEAYVPGEGSPDTDVTPDPIGSVSSAMPPEIPGASEPKPKSKRPLVMAAAGILLIAGVGGYYVMQDMLASPSSGPKPQTMSIQQAENRPAGAPQAAPAQQSANPEQGTAQPSASASSAPQSASPAPQVSADAAKAAAPAAAQQASAHASMEGRRLYVPAKDILSSAGSNEQKLKVQAGELKANLEVEQLKGNIDKVVLEGMIAKEKAQEQLDQMRGKKSNKPAPVAPPKLLSIQALGGSQVGTFQFESGQVRMKVGDTLHGFTVLSFEGNSARIKSKDGVFTASMQLPDRYPVNKAIFASKSGQAQQSGQAGQMIHSGTPLVPGRLPANMQPGAVQGGQMSNAATSSPIGGGGSLPVGSTFPAFPQR